MRIVVNHVTRMTGSRICVAGIDTATYRHVRPVTPPDDPLTRVLLRENGGPFGAGALVDIGRVMACPDAPETEDHGFDVTRAKRVSDVPDATYLELLGAIGETDIRAAFGPALVRGRPESTRFPPNAASVRWRSCRSSPPSCASRSDKLYL